MDGAGYGDLEANMAIIHYLVRVGVTGGRLSFRSPLMLSHKHMMGSRVVCSIWLMK